MKTLITLIILTLAGYFGYEEYINSPDAVKVTGNVQVTQQGNFNINAPQVSGPLYIASVTGTIKNISGKPLSNIYIKYNVAGKTSSAMVFNLQPDQSINYTTQGVKTKAKNPAFSFESVEFEESD